MSDIEFQKYKTGLLTRILEEDKTLRDQTERYWRDIDMKHFEFDSRERLAEAVRAVEKSDFLSFSA